MKKYGWMLIVALAALVGVLLSRTRAGAAMLVPGGAVPVNGTAKAAGGSSGGGGMGGMVSLGSTLIGLAYKGYGIVTSMLSASPAAAGVALAAGPTAIEAGAILGGELGPSVATSLLAATPEAAAAGVVLGAGPTAVEAGAILGAELGPAAIGAEVPVVAPIAAIALPVAAAAGIVLVALRAFGVIGPMSDTQAAYDYATQSIGMKWAQGYTPRRFALEYPDLPGWDQIAIQRLVSQWAFGPNLAEYVGEGMPFLLPIMLNENRFPTALEVLLATNNQAMFRAWTRENWQSDFGPFAGSLASSALAGRLTMDPEYLYFDAHYGTDLRRTIAAAISQQPTIPGRVYTTPVVFSSPLGLVSEDRGG